MPFAGWPPDLWHPQIAAQYNNRRPIKGAMEPFVGTQYTVEQIWNYYRIHADVYPDEEARLRPLAARIRAFNVPALSKVMFTSTRLDDIGSSLHALLLEKLPGIPWDVFQVHLSRIKKYGLIHEVVEAPLDEATQSATVLEIYGHLESVNGQAGRRGGIANFIQATRLTARMP
jgi:hypothetical protein